MSDGAALVAQDTLQMNLNDLTLTKAYIESGLNGDLTYDTGYDRSSVVQAWEAENLSGFDETKVTYFADPRYTSTDDFNLFQSQDNTQCGYNSYFMRGQLQFDNGSLDKSENWIGFANGGGVCQFPAQNYEYLTMTDPEKIAVYPNNICKAKNARLSLECQSWYEETQYSDIPTVL